MCDAATIHQINNPLDAKTAMAILMLITHLRGVINNQ
jgi:hypothetical protein